MDSSTAAAFRATSVNGQSSSTAGADSVGGAGTCLCCLLRRVGPFHTRLRNSSPAGWGTRVCVPGAMAPAPAFSIRHTRRPPAARPSRAHELALRLARKRRIAGKLLRQANSLCSRANSSSSLRVSSRACRVDSRTPREFSPQLPGKCGVCLDARRQPQHPQHLLDRAVARCGAG